MTSDYRLTNGLQIDKKKMTGDYKLTIDHKLKDWLMINDCKVSSDSTYWFEPALNFMYKIGD